MRKKKILNKLAVLASLFLMAAVSFGFLSDDRTGVKPVSSSSNSFNKTNVSGKQGDSYRFFINNMDIPMDNRGVLGAVNIPPPEGNGSGGKFANNTFLFSGGFFMSGKTNGQGWANAQATASLVENWVPGTVADGTSDPRNVVYVVNGEDEPFGQSWEDWRDAVSLGADFYDGNGDGIYDPVDLNSNGEWDPDEDMPDLVGDEVAWCVYNDGQEVAQRSRFAGVNPQGIEIRQSVFGFASKGAIGNIMFVRYRIVNTGSVAEVLDSVFFGVWADPDLGNHLDDLVGVDVPRNAGYVYNEADDDQYGANPPCFMIDFFSGPESFIPGVTFTDVNGNGVYDDGVDTALDTAFNVRGQRLGVRPIPGATNLGISSFVHYQQSDPDLGDPNTRIEARNYMLGLDKLGNQVDPCNWALGEVRGGVNCATLDNRFWYSGDPVTNVGWINTTATDQRQMQNTGPFNLVAGETVEIMVAYIVGQGTDAISSITKARSISDGAQFIFDQNFASPTPPPSITPEVLTSDGFIDLYFDTYKQVNYTNVTDAWDLRFHGINVYAYRQNDTRETVDNQPNLILYKSFQLDNPLQNIFKQNPETDGIEPLYASSENRLDPVIYGDEERGKIRVRITEDPFTGGDLIKGKEYYFAVTAYALNYEGLIYRSDPDSVINWDNAPAGDYYLTKDAFTAESENVPKITVVTMGENIYDPPSPIQDGGESIGGTSGELQIDIIRKDELTGNEYEVGFFIDSTTTRYSTFWKLNNITAGGPPLLDSMKTYLYGNEEITGTVTDGFIIKLSDIVPQIGALEISDEADWVDSENSQFHYVSTDIAEGSRIDARGLSNLSANYLKADKIRRVELRFNESGKAYRYLNGFKGSLFQRRNSNVFAEAVTEADTGGIGLVGKLGQGFVDVPFTAWVDDEAFGEQRQLAVGFIERDPGVGGNPDGLWDPGTDISQASGTGEFIIVFNATYDPDGNQQIYKGGFQDGSNVVWADLRGGTNYNIPSGASVTAEERKIASSPLFDALYVFEIVKADSAATNFQGTLTAPVTTYPYTTADKFTFSTTAGGRLLEAQEKEIFEKVNVYPNPLFGYNVATSYDVTASADQPFVTFSNLPTDITIKIYSLSGTLLRTLGTDDKSSPTSPRLRWDLQNEAGLRVASGMYLAIVSSPKYGDKVLKFAIVMPQKQIQKY
jgi:hypothetical protein